MYSRLISKSCVINVALMAFLFGTASVLAAGPEADWWQAQRDATITLMRQGGSIAALSAQLAVSRPAHAQDSQWQSYIFTTPP